METFAPVATVLAISASKGFTCFQNDVPSAFL
jgi:hypothetical protein